MIILVECLVLSRFLEEYTGPGLRLQAPSLSRLIQLFCKCSGKEHGGQCVSPCSVPSPTSGKSFCLLWASFPSVKEGAGRQVSGVRAGSKGLGVESADS